MKKLLAPLVALAFGLASISAFAAEPPAKDTTGMQKTDKKPAAKKARKSSKKSSAKAKKEKEQPAAGATK